MTQITNTLFRFATTRSPQLVGASEKENYYIQHPNAEEEGFFAEQIATPESTPAEQRTALLTKAATFTPLTEKEIAETVGVTGPLASWLAKNKAAYIANPDIFDTSGLSVGPLDSETLIDIWDNLFYQLITNESPSIRDLLIEILVADNFANHFNPEYPNPRYADSTVVIPKNLYGSSELSESEETEAPPVFVKPLQKEINSAVAQEKLERLNVLDKELETLQKTYIQTNAAAFQTAKEAYETDYNIALKENTQYNEETTEVKVVRWDAVPFEFTPADEITVDTPDQLTSASKLLFLELYLAQIKSFDEARRVVTEEIKRQQEIIFESGKYTERVVLLNNVPLPVNTVPTGAQNRYAFYMQATPLNNNFYYKIQAVIAMGQTGADVVHASYQAKNGMTITETEEFTDRPSGTMLMVELFPQGLLVGEGNITIELSGYLFLSDGTRLSFDTDFTVATGAKGWMDIALTTQTGEEEEEPTSPGATPTPFVPSGFGIRRLGIADYRQVEQTTCCYVPGEVSHIENVMAREYKEKSSRRLRRSENTTTVERQTEKEDLTDTTSTDRYEMQQQTSEVLNSDKSFSLNSNSQFTIGKASFGMGSNFASNSSQQQSNSQAVTYAKDITKRAQERVVQKIREERTLKIIDEYEEQNKHGFDNRKGDAHVSGVYRWVDKVYTNKVFNYGKRLMYEFMIPQPSVFHNEAMKTISNSPAISVLEKPVDPRTATNGLRDHRDVSEHTAAAWASLYNAEIDAAPESMMSVSKSWKLTDFEQEENEIGAIADKVDVPDGYKAVSAKVNYAFYYHPNKVEFSHIVVTVADVATPLAHGGLHMMNRYDLNFERPVYQEVAVGIQAGDLSAFACNVVVRCERTDQLYKQWQLDSFNLIIKAYEEKLAAYTQSLAAQTSTSQANNPLFYRQIENIVLRKNCVDYLVGNNNIGENFYTSGSVGTITPALGIELDRYASLAKFIEQAFEWEILSYTFYPFYWGRKTSWQSLYQVEVDDALFRSFLQSGMARVIVTVRPGFEEAVMYYMATGQVWNGGQVPVIGDDLYLSIVEELKNPTYYVEETWETRVPTTLTVIQSDGIGLNATGLPCCHVGEETGIVNSTAKMEGGDSTPEEDPGGGE